MKFVISFAVLALAVTLVSARCRSGSTNKPDCAAGGDATTKYQDDWDAGAYLVCDAGEVKKVRCEDGKCFYGTGSDDCVPCKEEGIQEPECTDDEPAPRNDAAEQLDEPTRPASNGSQQKPEAFGQNEERPQPVRSTTEQVTKATDPETSAA